MARSSTLISSPSDLRLDVVVDRRGLGEGAEHVERRQRPGGRLNAARLRGDVEPQPLEQLELALEDALVGAEHLPSYS